MGPREVHRGRGYGSRSGIGRVLYRYPGQVAIIVWDTQQGRADGVGNGRELSA